MESKYPPLPLWLNLANYSALFALGISVGGSLLLLATKPRGEAGTGQIQLPMHAEPPMSNQKELEKILLSHVDTSLKKDGVPVDLEAFWNTVFWRRGILLLAVFLNFALQLGHSIVFLPYNIDQDLAKQVLDILVAAYTLGLALTYNSTSSLQQHCSITIHLCCVGLIQLITRYLFTFGQALSMMDVPASHWSDHAAFVLSLAQLAAAVLIPLGPKLYQDPSRMYNSAVSAKLNSIPSTVATNVIGDVSSTMLGKALLFFVFPMLVRTAKMEQVDVDELPLLPSDLRTQNIVPQVADVWIPQCVKQWGATWEIIYLVWSPQLKAVLKYCTIVVVVTPLAYLPHWCLQQILVLLDQQHPHVSALPFVLLLVIAMSAIALLTLKANNIVSFHSEPRITAHTTWLLYQKLLTRNTHLAPPLQNSTSNTRTTASTADILNLVSSDATRLVKLGWTVINLLETLLDLGVGCFYVWALLGSSGLFGLSSILITCLPAYFFVWQQYIILEKHLKLKDENIGLMQEAIQAIAMIKMSVTEGLWFKKIKDVKDKEFRCQRQAKILGSISTIL